MVLSYTRGLLGFRRSPVAQAATLTILLCVLGLLSFAHAAVLQARPESSSETRQLARLFKVGGFKDSNGKHLAYRYFEPADESARGDKSALVIYLHGEQEAGTDNKAQLTTTDCATVWVEPQHLKQHPVYVIAPQLPKGEQWTDGPVYASTLALLQQFLQGHPGADRNRVYLVGFSMGATGVYNLLLKNPRLFAAAMLISGSADDYLSDTKGWAALKNTPVIIVHSYDDAVVPVSAALNAAAALQAGGNRFLGYGAPTPSLWSPGSTASPHDAWFTAFHKFEVIYNSLFVGDLARTNQGEISPTEIYSKRDLGDGITQVWDYALGTSFVIERPDKAVIIDTTMGRGSIYHYIRDHVLQSKDVPLEIFLTHQHEDHTLGLVSFVGASQLRKVYVHQEDSAPIRKLLGPDASKLTPVKDGDLIPLGNGNVQVIGVPGHTLGSIIMKYGHYLFSGDSIGTGYIGVGAFSVEQYISSLQHLLDVMGDGKYTIYGGHTGELTAPMTEAYVHNLMNCARAIVNNTVPAHVYWRGRDSALRRISTVGDASITYSFDNVHRIPGALRSLRISPGVMYPGFSPEFNRARDTPGFSPAIVYYSAATDASTDTVEITPTVLEARYKSLTVNGTPVRSGETYPGTLQQGLTRFAITVTAADGATREYFLDVTRAAHEAN